MLIRLLPTGCTSELIGERNGWRFEELRQRDSRLRDFDDLVLELGRHGPALGAFVYDSDFAYVVVAAPDIGPARLVQGLESAES